MHALLLAVVVTAGVHHHSHPPGHCYWMKRHLDCRTLVRYGSCAECGNNCTCEPGGTYNYRADFDYLWHTKQYRPKCGTQLKVGQPVVVPIEPFHAETIHAETISPPEPAPTLIEP